MKTHPVLNETSRHEDLWEVEVELHVFLTSALDGGERSDSRHGRFTSMEIAPVPSKQGDGWATEPVWTR